jgi:two-component system LytT family response regulator
MLSCYIIDDEEHPVELLRSYVERTPELMLLGWSNDPLKGMQKVGELRPDILFLDVDMPGISGIDVYRILGDSCRVVFTTAHMQYAVDAYDLAAADFLLKPIRFERFLKSVHRIRNAGYIKDGARNEKEEAAIFLQTGQKGKLVRVLINEIVYVETMGNYVKIHLPKETLTVYISLRELSSQLPEWSFERIHKSYLVNFARITGIEGNRVWLEGGHEVPLGIQFREPFIEKVNRRTLKK